MPIAEKVIARLINEVFHLQQLLQRPIHSKIEQSRNTHMNPTKIAYMKSGLRTFGGVALETANFNQNCAENQSSVRLEPSTAACEARESEIRETNMAILFDIDDTAVSVARKQGRFSQITMEMTERVTDEEYMRFVEAQRSAGNEQGDVDCNFTVQNEEGAQRNAKATGITSPRSNWQQMQGINR